MHSRSQGAPIRVERGSRPGRLAAAAGALLALLALCSPAALAGGGPESIFLVVNARGPISKEVANHYVALRRVPPNNIFYLPAPPNARMMPGLEFRQKLLGPILAEINKRGLQDQIDQIVYSCQFPYQIDFSTSFASANPPATNRPIASLTGATFLYQFVEANDANLVQLNTNFYFAPGDDAVNATRAFRGRYQWAPGGARVASGGLKYYLSTMIGVTDVSGNTAAEMRTYLERAAAADGTRPDGVFYYMKNDNVRSKVRHDSFAAAVAELRSLGLRAEIANGVVPRSIPQVLGLTTGAAQVPLRGSGSQLAPGALVDNLTSAGAQLMRTNNPNPQTRVTEYLRLGAAGASGTIIEPYAIPQKFPSALLHVHYARGCSMAEAFYQSVQGPYQLLVVGDPLCQPWAHIPQVDVPGIDDGQTLAGSVDITPTATGPADSSIRRFQLFVDGVRQQDRIPGQSFALDTTALADGEHELRILAVDSTPIETEGRWIANVVVKNGRDAVSLSARGGNRVTGPQLTLIVSSTVEGETIVSHNGRVLGRVSGTHGTLNVPTEQLGKGPVTLDARLNGSPGLRSRPLRLEIL